MLPIKVKYLVIAWDEHKNVVKLEKSIDFLEIIQKEDEYQVESVTYPRVEGNAAVLGFHFKEKNLHTPYFLMADGQTKEDLLRVVDPDSGEVWWIQNGKWHSKKYFYKNEIVRSAGRYTLVANDNTLTILNHTVNFTVEELEYYLNDFKNSFWQIIINNNSASKARIKQSKHCYFDNDVIELLSLFNEYCERLIKKPNAYLSEVQGSVPIKLVKPLPKTFREYSTRPNAKNLTSRTHKESYDTPENRFIHYCISRIVYIFKNIHNISKRQKKLYEQHIDTALKWKKEIDKNIKIVDEYIINNEIYFLENKQKELENSLLRLYKSEFSSANNSDNIEAKTRRYCLLLGGSYQGNDTFFVEVLNGTHKRGFKEKYGVEHILIRFPNNFSGDINAFSGIEFDFHGKSKWKEDFFANGKRYFILIYIDFELVKITKNTKLNSLYNEKIRYESANWIAPLSVEEIEFRNSEIISINKKIQFYTDFISDIEAYSSKINFLVKNLSKKLTFFVENKIKKSSNSSNSMVFIQNNTYRVLKNTYAKLLTQNGLDDSIINALTIVDEIGLVNISTVYERWCLLQIINVISSVYGFFPVENWQENLISAILHNKYNVRIPFQAPHSECTLLLTYEKEIYSSDKQKCVRPDFVLELIEGENRISAQLTLDAKFRGNELNSKLYEVLEDISYKKNYRQDGSSSVYVLHPVAKAVSKPTSPLMWGKFCDYGQNSPLNHTQGLIFLSPTRKHQDSMENIQRLLGMFIQKNYIQWANQPGEYPSRVICASCGNHDFRPYGDVVPQRTKNNNSTCFISCPKCLAWSKQSHCKSCGTLLFKNGFKWTYHRTKASEITNIICPNCGDYF